MASDQGFTKVVASGEVAETPNRTSFRPSSDLASGTTYYWRVRAGDTATGTTSGYSVAQVFTTVNPDDGIYRYNLTLHLVSASDCYKYPSGTPEPAPFYDKTFDDGLTVSGDQLGFGPPSTFSTLVFNLVRSGDQLSGTFQGLTEPWAAGMGPLLVTFNMSIASATVDNTSGRLTGILSGSYSDEGFPTYRLCRDSRIAFTLTRHP